MLHAKISNEFNRLNSRIQQITQQLKSLPEGKLTYSQTGKYSKWYQSTSQGRTYIPKSKRSLAEQLALKTYLTHLHKELLAEQKILKHYLDHHVPAHVEQTFLSNPVFHELLAPQFKPLFQELEEWANAPYPTNPFPNKFSTFTSPSGHRVRSKSELLIDMTLSANKIPFRHECALQLGDDVIYPDFTIRHPKTGEYFFYEHFGMADDPKYSHKIGERIQRYISNGIIPGINLIISFETKNHPLDPLWIEETIHKYFLE